jgi:Protein of unknown function (DUF2510)
MSDQPEGSASPGGRPNGALILLVGAAALVVGALLPWATASAGFISVSKAGTDGDGVITLVLGAVIALFALFALKPQPHQLAVLVGAGAGLAAGGVAIYDIVNVSDAVTNAQSQSSLVHASVGSGLYVTAVGAAIAVVGALVKNGETQKPANRAKNSGRVSCPHCAEQIMPAATVCPHCNREVTPSALPPPSAGTTKGWMPDPSGRHPDRYWDGRAWTQWVRDKPGGTRSEDPPVPAQS